MRKMRIVLCAVACLGLALILFDQKTWASANQHAYHSEGSVEFIPNGDPTDPVDPEKPDPEKPVDPVGPNPGKPGSAGPLSVDFASSFDFGMHEISNVDAVYYARAQKYNNHEDTPNFVQVSDNRGMNSGWSLKVKQNSQCQATNDTTYKELTGARIILTSPKINSNSVGVTAPIAVETVILIPDGTESLVMSAGKHAGAGTWDNYWGKVEAVSETDASGNQQLVNVTKAVSLEVPGNTPKDAVRYKTTLTWILTDVPSS